MTEITIDGEQTVTVSDEVVKLTNCMSFQNIGTHGFYWSTKDFSDDNMGSFSEPYYEVLFSDQTVVYINVSPFVSLLQARSEAL